MTRVLFVCVKNGGKSQMAAGLLRRLVTVDQELTVTSAGTRAGTTLNAASVASLAELGVDLTGERPQQLTEAMIIAADVVITVGGEAVVPRVAGPAYETWEIDEPSLRGVEGDERMRLVRDDIDRHVRDLHRRLTRS